MSFKSRQPRVYLPSSLQTISCDVIHLYGIYHESSNSYNVISLNCDELHGQKLDYLGFIGSDYQKQIGKLIGGYDDGKLCVYTDDGKLCSVDFYSLKLDILSRNTGILESEIMLSKKVIFIGCGSVGSFISLQLAKAGVGHFLLIDGDIFSYHNICRHQCGIYDVGRYKCDALRDRILQINPEAEVIVSNSMLQEMDLAIFEHFCDENTIVVGGADNREGDLFACMLAKEQGAPFVSIGCWKRAFAGEIFYCLPDGMPDYSDFVYALGGLSGRVSDARKFYSDEEDLAKASFEPGISADIDFVSIIGVKLILDLFNRNNDKYTQRLLKYLSQYTLVCNTVAPEVGGVEAEIFSYPLQVTTSIYVPYKKESES